MIFDLLDSPVGLRCIDCLHAAQTWWYYEANQLPVCFPCAYSRAN